MMTKEIKIDLFADYFQFYIQDENVDGNLSDSWTQEAVDRLPDAKRIDIEKGIYRARIYYGNLDKISEDGLDGDDYYEIHLWPTKEKSDIKIVKSKNASA